MFTVYVLKSETTGKIYICQTDNESNRIKQHNSQDNNFSKYTKLNKGPWVLICKEKYVTRKAAMKREKQLKSSRGRQFVRDKISGR